MEATSQWESREDKKLKSLDRRGPNQTSIMEIFLVFFIVRCYIFSQKDSIIDAWDGSKFTSNLSHKSVTIRSFWKLIFKPKFKDKMWELGPSCSYLIRKRVWGVITRGTKWNYLDIDQGAGVFRSRIVSWNKGTSINISSTAHGRNALQGEMSKCFPRYS